LGVQVPRGLPKFLSCWEAFMRAKGTWVFMFFFLSTLIVGAVFHFAFRDLFSWFQINNYAVLGDSLRLSTVIGASLAVILGVFFGFFYKDSRQFVEQCVSEFGKVAFPDWKETKGATFTVVIFSIVASLILGVFDSVFSYLAHNNLFLW
jgi:preprotein translocase SecE subunit